MNSKKFIISFLICVTGQINGQSGQIVPQISPFNFARMAGGMEQIMPMGGISPSNYPLQNAELRHPQRYPSQITPFGGGGGSIGNGMERLGQFNAFGLQQQQQHQELIQQQLFLQQQQQRYPEAIRSNYGFPSSSIHPLTPISPSYMRGNNQPNLPYPASVNGQSHLVNSQPTPDIPMDIVVGHQIPDRTAVAFGSRTATTEGAVSKDQQLSSETASSSVIATDSKKEASSLPKFLQDAPPEAVDAFKRIIRTPNMSYEEQVSKIAEMVSQKLDAQHQELYKEFMKENDERENQHRERIHKTVSQMSPKAQEQFAKISAILRNPSVPHQERWDRVLNVYSRMDPTLRDEFEQQFKGFGSLQYL